MQPGKRFFATLDGIRGVAAIAVVLVHEQSLFWHGIAQENFLAVDIFFILSGVVIANAYEHRLRSGLTVVNFAKIRLIRLYPLYIFGTAIRLLVIMLGISSASDVDYFLLAVVLAIMILPDPFVNEVFPLNAPAWSLFFELFANIVYAFVLRLLTPRVLAAIMAVSALGLAGILYFGPNHDLVVGVTTKTLYGGFFRVGYSFFAGVLLYRLFASKKLVPNDDWRMAFMPWALLGLVALMLGAKPPASIRPYYEFAVVVLVFPAVVYCALFFEPMGVGAKICKFFGSVSYAVYAIHLPFLWLIGGMIERMAGVPVDNLAPWAGFGLVGVLLAFCFALDKLYDRPLRGFLLARGQSKFATSREKS